MTQYNEHLRAEELFSAYIDRRVTADEQAFVERHAAVCADCHAKLQATRAMITALHTLPMVKAPRSFVLPREMERQPKPSIFAWYPTLRLATAIAAIAFILVFAGDLLMARGGVPNVLTSAPAPQAEPMQMGGPTVAAMRPVEQSAVPPTAAPQIALEPSAPTAASGAVSQPAPMLPTAAAKMTGGISATTTDAQITATHPVTVFVPGVAAEAPKIEATPEPAMAQPPAADQSTTVGPVETTAPALDPLRVIEIALAALVVILLAATLIARRRTT